MPADQTLPAKVLPEIAAETPFYIPATGTPTRPRRTLKHGDTFVVVDSHGDIGASAGDADGLFHDDTRFLSHLELLVNGLQPLLLGSNLSDDNALLSVDLTNPDFYVDGQDRAAERHCSISRAPSSCGATRPISAWRWPTMATAPISLTLSLHFGSDFADLFEVRGLRRTRRGAAEQRVLGSDLVELSYRGLDRQTPRHDIALRSGTQRTHGRQGDLPRHARTGQGAADLPRGHLRRAGGSAGPPFLKSLHHGAARNAQGDDRDDDDRDLQRHSSTRSCAARQPTCTC